MAVTDFPFPRECPGMWRSLSREQREQWLIAARSTLSLVFQVIASMSTAIEKLLFRSYGTHGVKSISFRENALTVVVAPWTELENELDNELEANFSHALLDYIQSRDPEPGELELPWDIIAIDCTDVANGRWKFVLTCQAIEISFSAEWPEIVVKR